MKARIEYIMKNEGVTQQRFAEILGISAGSLSSILTGRTNPTANHVQAIHKVFPQISVKWLMFGEGDMYDSAAAGESAEPAAPAPEPAPTVSIPTVETRVGTPAQVIPGVRIIDKPPRQVTEVRIFFDDGTYETFSPAKGKEC